MSAELSPGMNQLYSENLSIRTMYQYDHHTNIPWNMTQYEPLKQYLDPTDIVLQRKYQSQKKGQKNNMYVTKRGFYMDYDLKISKGIPGANRYNQEDFWDYSAIRKKNIKKKVDPKLIKYTYLDQIQIEQKNRKKPGISAYHLIPTDKQIEARKKKLSQKKRSQGPKKYFYEDTQYLSNLVPGAGAHNPRLLKHKIKIDNTDRKFWTDKHKKNDDLLRKRRLLQPGSATYKPMPGDRRLFQHLLATPSTEKSIKNGFGTDQKFQYQRQLKVKDKKIKEVRPSPATYNTFIQWPSKIVDSKHKEQKSKHKKNWFFKISRGYSQGVYH